MKKLIALLMLVCMMVCLCACGDNANGSVNGDNNNKQNEQNDTTAAPTTPDPTEPEKLPEYVAYVKDQDGNPVANVMIQICKDTCMPTITDENGKAVWETPEAEGYKVSFPSGVPGGYQYMDESVTEFYYDAGSKEITVTLKKFVPATYTVYVQDEAGNPVAGVWVALSKEGSTAVLTDEDGEAEWVLAEKGDYTAAIEGELPEGYALADETVTEFEFDENLELTVTLKAIA